MRRRFLIGLLATFSALGAFAAPADPLFAGFQNPPAATRPVVWWRFMDDIATREGVIADLDSMQRTGLSGAVVSYCTSNSGMSKPVAGLPVIPILSDAWWDLIGFKITEATRRDLDLWFQLCPGYATSGGPWITPELSMQKLVWRETTVPAGQSFDAVLPRADVDPKWNFHRDVAVLAFPSPAANAAVPPASVIELTDRLAPDGRLRWTPPTAAEWIIVRLGHTTTGKPIHPVTAPAAGLECDKLSRVATRLQFDSYFAKILARQPASAREKIQVFFDSWEADNQNWTPGFRNHFRRLRGYDPLPWLLVATGRLVGDESLSRRFDQDWKTTIEELINSEHFAELARLSREHGAHRLRAQPYNGPINFMTAGALFDIPEAEFWFNKPEYGWWSLRMIASVAHVNGKKVAAAEALTAMPADHRADADPFATKAETDLAFAHGINHLALHAQAHNPWPALKPGQTTGFFPPLVGPGQIWNDFSGPWITYLARCSHLLQQGDFVADVLTVFRPNTKGYTPPTGFAGDLCPEELVVSSLTWDGSALRLPSGMRYRVLELQDNTEWPFPKLSPSGLEPRLKGKPRQQSISLPLLRKLHALVSAGATVVGPRPSAPAGLTGYPESDREFTRLVAELWGPHPAANTSVPTENRFGRGRVFSGLTAAEALARLDIAPDFKTIENIRPDDVPWLHRRIGDDDLYFVSNQRDAAVSFTASFRVTGKILELWHADTGTATPARVWFARAGRTEVTLDLDPYGSVFVRFRPGPVPAEPVRLPVPTTLATFDLSPNWTAHFNRALGGPTDPVSYPNLTSWTSNASPGIRHYSGVATYERAFTVSADLLRPSIRLMLDLGTVKNLARVTVNGVAFPELWKPPFTCDITAALRPGENQLVVEVVNVWANRLVGDEHEPADIEWARPKSKTSAGRPIARPLAFFPDWLLKNQPRPSSGRVTFTTWNYIDPDQPLLPSGLLGPVTLTVSER